MAAALVVINAATMDMATTSVEVAGVGVLQRDRFRAHVECCGRKDGVVEVVLKVRVVIKEFGEAVCVVPVDFGKVISNLT